MFGAAQNRVTRSKLWPRFRVTPPVEMCGQNKIISSRISIIRQPGLALFLWGLCPRRGDFFHTTESTVSERHRPIIGPGWELPTEAWGWYDANWNQSSSLHANFGLHFFGMVWVWGRVLKMLMFCQKILKWKPINLGKWMIKNKFRITFYLFFLNVNLNLKKKWDDLLHTFRWSQRTCLFCLI